MKNVSLILNVVLIFALLYCFFKEPEKAAISSNDGTSDCNNVCMDYSNDSVIDFIDASVLRTMSGSYQATNRRPVIQPTRGDTVPDANSVWFGIHDLKRFIWYVEKTVCENHCNSDSLNLGIRLYYARYDSSVLNVNSLGQAFTDLKDYENMHTVFMIPTYDDSNSLHVDLNLSQPFNNCQPDSIGTEGSVGQVGIFLPRGKNHGTLCPPICGGTAF